MVQPMKYIYKKLVKWIFAILVFDLQLSSLLAFFRQNGNGGKPVHDGGDCHQPVITNGIKFFEERKKKRRICGKRTAWNRKKPDKSGGMKYG